MMVDRLQVEQRLKLRKKKKLLRLMALWHLYRQHVQTKRSIYMQREYKSRRTTGEYARLVIDKFALNDTMFFEYFRMSKDDFDYLHNRIQPLISHASTHAYPITTRERLALTLRVLASGESFSSIHLRFLMGTKTVQKIFHETCVAIWEILKDDYAAPPTSEEDWASIRNDFWNMWNFPNCLGAIDGKHIRIKAPPNSGSRYFNYKGYTSTVLLAIVDAKYNFRLIDIGAYGRDSDGGVLARSNLGKRLVEGNLGFKKQDYFPGTEILCNNVFIGDEAFPSKSYLLRPYPGKDLTVEQRVYNYRLSRARRIVENAFGILCSRWRIFKNAIELLPENVDNAVKAAICLHNFCNQRSQKYATYGIDKQLGSFTKGKFGGNKSSEDSRKIREMFNEFLNSEFGAVSWQDDYIRSRQI